MKVWGKYQNSGDCGLGEMRMESVYVDEISEVKTNYLEEEANIFEATLKNPMQCWWPDSNIDKLVGRDISLLSRDSNC